MKVCGRCERSLDFDDFASHPSTADRLQTKCRECTAAYDRERRAARTEADILKERDRDLRRRYGISLDQYQERSLAQAGRCAICSGPGRVTRGQFLPLVVDHDHETGEVRGLLCGPCNSGLGLLGDDVDGILAALEYLRG